MIALALMLVTSPNPVVSDDKKKYCLPDMNGHVITYNHTPIIDGRFQFFIQNASVWDFHIYSQWNFEKNMNRVLGELKFTDKKVLKLSKDILRECIEKSKTDIVISKTGDNELLIYRKEGVDYRNLIIDSEGNIEFLFIPENRKNTISEYFPVEEHKFEVTSLLEKL